MIIDVFTSTITKPNTVKKYICDVKRVFKLSGITSFTGSLEEFFVIKESMANSKYSISTIKGSFLTVAVNFGLGGSGDVVSTVAQTSGVWIFYAITTTATQTLLYVNGVLVRTGNFTYIC
jgi:hypothetical protein